MKVSAEYPQERHLIDQREPSIDLNGSHQATDDRSPSHLPQVLVSGQRLRVNQRRPGEKENDKREGAGGSQPGVHESFLS